MKNLKLKISLLTTVLSIMLCTPVMAAVRDTDKAKPKDGNMLVAVEGTFSTATKAQVLDRINEIRKEACDNRYVNPSTGAKLKPSDYVPIKWSSDLEWIAQTRAAEASVNESHTRPNGEVCFALTHNGVNASAENLAWNHGGMMDSIEQWYGEKEDWVKQNKNAVTGHYTSLIDPELLCVGIGTFKIAGKWTTTAGMFSYKSGLSEKKVGVTGKYNQVIEVPAANVEVSLGNASVVKGGTKTLKLKAKITGMSSFLDSNGSISGYVAGGVTWSSSNPSVVSINSEGRVTGNSYGDAVVTAKVEGKKATAQVTCAGDAVVAKVKTLKLKNLKGKKLKITYKAAAGAKGYQIQYAKNSKFTKGKKTITVKGRSKTVKLKKGVKYYVRVRAYTFDSNNKKIYGAWSNKKSLKIKK